MCTRSYREIIPGIGESGTAELQFRRAGATWPGCLRNEKLL